MIYADIDADREITGNNKMWKRSIKGNNIEQIHPPSLHTKESCVAVVQHTEAGTANTNRMKQIHQHANLRKKNRDKKDIQIAWLILKSNQFYKPRHNDIAFFFNEEKQ